MPPINNDAIGEKITPPESSTEEKTTPNVSEDDETLGSGSKNFDDRFKEIYAEKKRLERENEELKSKVKEPEETSFQPNTWDEVIDHVEKKITEKQSLKEKTIESEMSLVNKQIEDLKSLNPKLNEDDLWDYMDKNKTLNVYEAFLKTQNVVKTPKENKDVSRKIGDNTKNTIAKSGLSYAQLHKMSLDDL